jgi:hypothetical protein
MSKSMLTVFVMAILVMAMAMIVSGCTTTVTPAPTATPSPSATPTPAPTATMSPMDKKYQYIEQLQAGINNYNKGVGYVDTAKTLINASDYLNGSEYYKMAGDQMVVAKNDFQSMLPYASTQQEINLSQKWVETADYYSMSYLNASAAYNEYANEYNRSTPNLYRYNIYVQQAQYYNDLAAESRQQAEAIEREMSFIVPVTTPV